MTGSPLLFIYSGAATIDSTAAAPLASLEHILAGSSLMLRGLVPSVTRPRTIRHEPSYQ